MGMLYRRRYVGVTVLTPNVLEHPVSERLAEG